MDIPDNRVTSDNARRNWRDVLDRVQGGDSIIVTRAGKAIAVVIPIELWELGKDELERLDDSLDLEKKIIAYARGAQAGNVERDPRMDRLVKEDLGLDLPPIVTSSAPATGAKKGRA